MRISAPAQDSKSKIGVLLLVAGKRHPKTVVVGRQFVWLRHARISAIHFANPRFWVPLAWSEYCASTQVFVSRINELIGYGPDGLFVGTSLISNTFCFPRVPAGVRTNCLRQNARSSYADW